MRQAWFVDRNGETTRRDVPDREWGRGAILMRTPVDGGRYVETLFKSQLWRNGTDKNTDTFIWVEDGAPDDAVQKAGRDALAGVIR